MGSMLARCVGIARGSQVVPEDAIVVLERCSRLSRAEARVLLLDYCGRVRDQICAELCVAAATGRTYWKRIYRKIGCRTRAEARAWLEQLLQRETG